VTTSSQSRRNLLLLAPVFFFPLILLAILFLFRSSSLKRAIADPAIYAAQSSPAVAAQIGLPIEPGWPIRGTVRSRQGSGNADLQILVSGSRAHGVLFEWAQQDRGKWRICSLEFRSADGSRLNLVDSATTHCEPE
jgi:hypothetical protein